MKIERETMSELLFLEPVLKEVIWGGNQLKSHFGYELPSDTVGEAWVVSGHKNGDCRVRAGRYQGMTLGTLWKEHRELFGHQQGEQFPLLIKIIDARDDLSVQVHPDDKYAGVHEQGSLGKTECWYILDCVPDASIVIGHNALDRQEMQEMIANGDWNSLLKRRTIQKGDFFQIEPGTVHAIQRGTMILEIQQSSDITYRLYDYGRLQNGVPRQLHLEKCMDVIRFPHSDVAIHRDITETEQYVKETMIQCSFYSVEHVKLHGTMQRQAKPYYEMVNVLAGEGKINGITICKGENYIIPYGYGEYVLEGNMELMLSWP